MYKMKKVVSLFLAVVMITAVFCSCSKGGSKHEKLSYTYDSYYSDYSEFDKNVVKSYEKLCGAVVNGEKSVKFDIDLLEDVNRLYYTSFPLSVLVEKMSLNEKKDGLNIEYVNDLETHKKLVSEFTDKVNQIMEECGYNKVSQKEYVLNTYSYVASKIEYDVNYTTTYEAIVKGYGSTSSYTSVFNYLLLQAGINATQVYGLNSNGLSFMSMAEIDNENYLFAPCNENKANKGFGLSFFGISYSDVLKLGFTDGFKYTNEEAVVFDETTEKYSNLRDTVSYDYEDGKITAIKSNGSSVEVEL